MDQIALVTEQIDDGRRLVERLIQEGIPVSVAGWASTAAYEGWYLFIATPLRDKDGFEAYRRVQAVIRQMPQPFWVGVFDVKLLGPRDRLAQGMLSIYRKYPAKDGVRYTHRLGNGMDAGIEEAFIYPPPTTVPCP